MEDQQSDVTEEDGDRRPCTLGEESDEVSVLWLFLTVAFTLFRPSAQVNTTVTPLIACNSLFLLTGSIGISLLLGCCWTDWEWVHYQLIMWYEAATVIFIITYLQSYYLSLFVCPSAQQMYCLVQQMHQNITFNTVWDNYVLQMITFENFEWYTCVLFSCKV